MKLRVLDGTQTHDTPMRATGDGFHQLLAHGIGPGTDYQYRVNGQTLGAKLQLRRTPFRRDRRDT